MDVSQGGSNSPPPFLTKTYDMVDDPATDQIVSWSPTNSSFIVWNPPDFSRDLLPKYFKHNNFSSFVRQLNTYGFRKIDPDQWEFANEEFIRGQRHLLKNIHRRKPIHSHSLHHQNSSVPLAEAERQELEEEIERLKHDKSILILELKRHTQQQHTMDLQMQSLEERLHNMENRQRQIMAFLTQIVHRPGFFSNFMQQSEIHGKKRRLPKPDYFYGDADMEENRILPLETVTKEKMDTVSVQSLDTEPFEKMESSLNSLENFFRGVSRASGEEMYDCTATCLPSTVVLTEMHASSGDTDVNLQPQSPKLHPSSPCLREIRSSPELGETTSYVESPVIPSVELPSERPKISEIDVNLEPAAPEDPSLRNLAGGTTTAAAPTGVNDVFWEQFLTETPGSSDTQEVQSESQDTGTRKNEVKATAERGNFWWSRKNVEHITEQMGHLTPAERT